MPTPSRAAFDFGEKPENRVKAIARSSNFEYATASLENFNRYDPIRSLLIENADDRLPRSSTRSVLKVKDLFGEIFHKLEGAF